MEIKVLASGSKGNCYLLKSGDSSLLIEAGIPYKKIQQGIGFGVTNLDGCLISHEHGDHSQAVKDLMKTGVDVYTSLGTAAALKLSGHRLKFMVAGGQFYIGSWLVKPFNTQHDAAEPLGFLIAKDGEKCLYATDTFYLKYRFRELKYIMLECNYELGILNQNIQSGSVPAPLKKRIMTSHFSLSAVKDFLAANDLSRVKEIWLLHLSDSNSDSARFKKEIQELTGKVVKIA